MSTTTTATTRAVRLSVDMVEVLQRAIAHVDAALAAKHAAADAATAATDHEEAMAQHGAWERAACDEGLAARHVVQLLRSALPSSGRPAG